MTQGVVSLSCFTLFISSDTAGRAGNKSGVEENEVLLSNYMPGGTHTQVAAPVADLTTQLSLGSRGHWRIFN